MPARAVSRAIDLERSLFVRINDAPDIRLLRGPQQMGTPWALIGAAAVLAARKDNPRAVAALVALPLIKGLEVSVKETLRRPRPLYRVPTELRNDAPVEGGSFPSGHTAIAFAFTSLLRPVVPRWLSGPLWVMSAANGYVRVHQGAHWPADVVAGAGLGLAVVHVASASTRRAIT